MVRYKYRFVKDLCLDDVFFALKGRSIPAYLGYRMNGKDSVRDLINEVVYRYSHSGTRRHTSLRRLVKRYLVKKLRESKIKTNLKLEKFGFPIPC